MARLTEDLASFSRVLSSALLLVRVLLFSESWGARALVSEGLPWLDPSRRHTRAGYARYGAWQAWSFLKTGMRKGRDS